MSYHILQHESGKKCLFNTDNQTYQLIEPFDKTVSRINFGGVLFNFFDTVEDFIQSSENSSVVICFCSHIETKGGKFDVYLLSGLTTYVFKRAEKTTSNIWIRHCSDPKGLDKSAPKVGIEICHPNTPYLVYLVKEKDTINGLRVKSVMKFK